jgi:predicted Zn-dependent peptidase
VTVDKTTLKNGIRIVSKKMSHARSVSMGVWVNVGARFQIAKEFDAIGGHTNAFTAMENTCYHARVMDTHTETMVEILSDIFINSVFDPAEIDKERPVILQEIGMVEDSPEEYLHLLSGYNYWGENPLGRSILGSPQNIIQFDAQIFSPPVSTRTHRNFRRRQSRPQSTGGSGATGI